LSVNFTITGATPHPSPTKISRAVAILRQSTVRYGIVLMADSTRPTVKNRSKKSDDDRKFHRVQAQTNMAERRLIAASNPGNDEDCEIALIKSSLNLNLNLTLK
jgi:hypothetical protein